MSNTNNPMVSVIVLNYNGRTYIADCLASLVDQSFPKDSYEIILADNASTDGSLDIVRQRFPDARVVAFERNYGFCEGNNRAAKHALGKYLVFLNMDTVVHHKWLSELVNAVESDKRIKACQSNMLMPWVDEFQPFERERFPRNVYYYDLCRFGYAAYQSKPLEKNLIRSLFLEGASVLIERDWLEYSDHFFNPQLGSYCEDLDLALRVNIFGFRTVTVPASVVYHRHSLPMKTKADEDSVRRAIHIVKNRIFAFYMNMTNKEFTLFLPWLLIGSPLKVREFGWKLRKQLIYGVGAVPVTLVGLQQALSGLHRFRNKRQHNLKNRRRERWWLLRRVLASNNRRW